MPRELIKNIGEKELIKRLSRYMPANQTSDDCAFLKKSNQDLLINTDLMVENTHFNDQLISPKDIGWKAVISNISDLISSGCDEILAINIGLVLPSTTEWKWVDELYTGISEALSEYGGFIAGGDCANGNTKTICITVFGTQGKLKLRRYACKPGEVLLTTGIHGLSKLGFMLLNKSLNDDTHLEESLIKDAKQAFCRPKPNHKILQKIIKSNKDLKPDAFIGCTDSSDGIYQSLLDLANASNCRAVIDYKKLPKHELWPNGESWESNYFEGGEDYELIFSLPIQWAKDLMNIDNSISQFGYLKKGKPSIELINYPNNNLQIKSFSHF